AVPSCSKAAASRSGNSSTLDALKPRGGLAGTSCSSGPSDWQPGGPELFRGAGLRPSATAEGNAIRPFLDGDCDHPENQQLDQPVACVNRGQTRGVFSYRIVPVERMKEERIHKPTPRSKRLAPCRCCRARRDHCGEDQT